MIRIRPACLVFFCLLTVAALAQSPDAEANDAYRASDWQKAEPLYAQLTQTQPANARYWFRLAASLQGNGKHQPALDAFQKAQSPGAPAAQVAAQVAYSIAVVRTSMGRWNRPLPSCLPCCSRVMHSRTNSPEIRTCSPCAAMPALPCW